MEGLIGGDTGGVDGAGGRGGRGGGALGQLEVGAGEAACVVVRCRSLVASRLSVGVSARGRRGKSQAGCYLDLPIRVWTSHIPANAPAEEARFHSMSTAPACVPWVLTIMSDHSM